jgi:hypothetical protein
MKNRSRFRKMPVAALAIGVLLSIIALQCIEMPLAPIMPTSDIQMSIPLWDVTRSVEDMFTKDTSKVKRVGTGYEYVDNQVAAPVGLDSIKVSPQPSVNQVTVGRVSVGPVPTQTVTATVGQLGIPTGNVPGFPAPDFPAGSATFPTSNLDLSAQFDYVYINSGSLSLSVTNNLPVDITFPQPIVLKNNKTSLPADTAIMASFLFPATIARGTSATATATLAGKLLRGSLKVNPIAFNTASRPGPFTINTTDGISFGFSSTPLVADSAAAVIPNQQIVAINDSIITIDPTAVLQQATFSKGQFTFSLTNNLGITVGARLKFSNFVSTKPTLDTLIINQTLNAKSTFTQTVRLDTIQIVNGSPTGPGTTMKFSVGISTVTSAGAKATFTSSDFVRASFTPQNAFVVKSVTGIINPLTVPINAAVSVAGLGDADKKFKGSLVYDSVEIKIKFGISSGFPISHDLILYAIKKSAPTRTLQIPKGTIYPGLNTPGIITLNNSTGLSTFLSQITPNLPDSFVVRGTVVVDSARVSGTIYDTTKIYPSLSLRIPLKIGFVGGSYTDVFAIQAAVDTAFVEQVKKGTINFELTNRMPLAVSFRGAFLGRNPLTGNRDTLLKVPTDGSPRTILGATVDGSGYAIDPPVVSRFAITLVGTDADKFSKADSFYVKMDIATSGGNNAVRIQSIDNIRVRASGNLVYTFKPTKK